MMQDHIAALLDGLGRTPEEVRDALRAGDTQGARAKFHQLNPVIQSLQASVGGDGLLLKMIESRWVRLNSRGGTRAAVAVPDPVRRFPAAFNRGLPGTAAAV